jgi:hypothetical protein
MSVSGTALAVGAVAGVLAILSFVVSLPTVVSVVFTTIALAGGGAWLVLRKNPTLLG